MRRSSRPAVKGDKLPHPRLAGSPRDFRPAAGRSDQAGKDVVLLNRGFDVSNQVPHVRGIRCVRLVQSQGEWVNCPHEITVEHFQ